MSQQHLINLTGQFLRALTELGFGQDDEINGGDCVNVVGQHYGDLQKAWYDLQVQQALPKVSPFIALRLNGSVITVNVAQIEAIRLKADIERVEVTMISSASYSVLRDDGASIYATYDRITKLAQEATR